MNFVDLKFIVLMHLLMTLQEVPLNNERLLLATAFSAVMLLQTMQSRGNYHDGLWFCFTMLAAF